LALEEASKEMGWLRGETEEARDKRVASFVQFRLKDMDLAQAEIALDDRDEEVSATFLKLRRNLLMFLATMASSKKGAKVDPFEHADELRRNVVELQQQMRERLQLPEPQEG